MADVEPWRVSRMLPIIEGESLDGYISRVAAAHHFSRLAEVTSQGGAEKNNRQQAAFLDSPGVTAIAECLRIEPSTLLHHAPLMSPDGKRRKIFDIQLAADHFQFAYRRFSPSALEASPHHRALWNLRLFPFCLETWEYLEERCPHPACRRRQRWRRTLGVELCDYCGEPLTNAVAEKVPYELRQNLEYLLGVVHPAPVCRERARGRLPEALRKLDADDLIMLSCMLAAVKDPRRKHPIFSPTFCLDQARNVFVPALAETWPLLEGWPHAFEALLTERLNSSTTGQSTGTYRVAYHFLIRCRRRKLSPALRRLIEEFLSRCRNAPLSGIDGHQAAKIAGRVLYSLLIMRRKGELKSKLCLDGNRFYLLFDRHSVEQLARELKPQVTCEYLTARLGIPRYGVRDLVNRGLLTQSPVPSGRSERLAVFRDSADDLLESLAKVMPETTTDYAVPLSKLMYCLDGGPKPWGAVLAAILDGKLPAALAPGTHRLVDRIYLRSAKVIRLRMFSDRPKLDPQETSISKSDLADMLSLRVFTFSKYSNYLVGPGNHFVDIGLNQALDIAKRVISTTEIAARLQIHHITAYKLATHLGVTSEFLGLFERKSAFTLIPELDDLFCKKTYHEIDAQAILKDQQRIIHGKGKMRGKPPKLSEHEERELIRMHASGDYLIKDLANMFKVSRTTASRTIRRGGEYH